MTTTPTSLEALREPSWQRVQAFDDAARECERAEKETRFAEHLSADYRQGYASACGIIAMALRQMAREQCRGLPLPTPSTDGVVVPNSLATDLYEAADYVARRSPSGKVRDLVRVALEAAAALAAPTPTSDTDQREGGTLLSDQVDAWRKEWSQSDEKHWGDKIAWQTAHEIARRLDAANPKPTGADEAMREALERISAFGSGVTHGWANEVRSIARAALSHEKHTEEQS